MFSTRMRRLLAVALPWLVSGPTLLLAQSPGARQEPPAAGAYAERVDVEVVNVDVVVTDRDGKRVTSLGRGDFRLFVDGKPTPIDYFAGPAAELPPTSGAAPPATAEATAPAPEVAAAAMPPASLIIYIDQVAIPPGRRSLAVREIEKFLESALKPEDRAMVAVFEEDLRILEPFTNDRRRLAKALQEIGKMAVSGAYSAAQRRFLLTDIENQSRGDVMAGVVSDEIRQAIRIFVEGEVVRQRRSVAALANLLGTLAGVEGRKAVLLASAGLTERPGALLAASWRAKFGGEVWEDEGAFGLNGITLKQDYARMMRTAQGIRVAFYTIDAGEGESMISAENAGSADVGGAGSIDEAAIEARGNLRRLADETGGRYFPLSGQLDRALPEVLHDLSAAYSLGFGLPPELARGYHRIEVRVTDAALRLRHREGFRARSESERASDGVLAAAALAVVSNPLGISATPGTVKAAARGRAKLVPVLVKVPLRSLAFLPDGANRSARVTFQFALRDPQERLVLLESKTLPVAVPEAQFARALDQHLTYNVELPLDPGDYRVAVGVHDEVGDGSATVLIDVAVPKGS